MAENTIVTPIVATPQDVQQSNLYFSQPEPTRAQTRNSGIIANMLGNSKHASFSNYEDWVNNSMANGSISRKEFKDAARMFGWNKKTTKALRKDYKGKGDGKALKSVLNNLQRNYYIKDGKLFTQGEDGYNDADFDAAEKYKGTDLNALVDMYNKDVMNWRKKTKITYDPTNNTYTATGFNGSDPIDVTDSEWVTDAMKEQAELGAYGKAVDAYNGGFAGLYSGGNAADLLRAIGYKGVARAGRRGRRGRHSVYYELDPSKWSDKEREAAQAEIGDKMIKYYDKIAMPNGTRSWKNSVMADAWWKQMQNNFRGAKWINDLNWRQGGRYASFLNAGAGGERIGSHLGFKNGGSIQKAQLGTTLFGKDSMWGKGLDIGLSFIPGVNTLNQGLGYLQGNVSGKELALAAGIDMLGPAAKLLGGAYKAYKVYKGANAAAKTLQTAQKAEKAAVSAYNSVAKTLPEWKKVKEAEKVLNASKEMKEFGKLMKDPVANRKALDALNC